MHEQEYHPAQAAYLGDSLMKDIVMAQSAGVLDIHAQYGIAQHREGYDLLRRVTHWSDQHVEREKELTRSTQVVPTVVCRDGFEEVLPVFGMSLIGAR
jgi:phosphoglycolate phosphatase